MSKTVLLVGHCDHDTARIVAVLDRLDAKAERADDVEEAVRRVEDGGVDLVLGNRVIGFDQTGGIHLLEAVRGSSAPDTPVMILSAYEETQNAAVAGGGLRGFGKDDLETDVGPAVLGAALGEDPGD